MAKRGRKPSGLGGLDIEQLKSWAKSGAEATLARLRAEIAAIERTFPELSTAQGRGQVVGIVQKRASRMTAAGRAAVSARMKKYWAERRRAQATKKK